MSLARLERETIAHGSDLASLVIAYHHINHLSAKPTNCVEPMCRTASQVVEFETALNDEADA